MTMSSRPTSGGSSAGVSSDIDPFCHLSFGVAITLVVMNTVIGICGFVLNLLVTLAIVLNSKLRKDITNVFLGSLAIADLIINTLGQPAFSVQIIFTNKKECDDTWAFYVFTTSCSTSVFLSLLCLTMVTIERFLAVKAPVLHRRYLTAKFACGVIFASLIATVGFALLGFFERNGGDKTPLGRSSMAGVVCLVSLVMNTCTMVFTRRFLQRKARSSSCNMTKRKELQVKIRRVTLLLLLLIMALGAWFLVMIIVFLHFADLLTLAVVYSILTMIFLNSCLNPIAYCLMAPDIRKATHGLVRKINPLNYIKRQAMDGRDNGETQPREPPLRSS